MSKSKRRVFISSALPEGGAFFSLKGGAFLGSALEGLVLVAEYASLKDKALFLVYWCVRLAMQDVVHIELWLYQSPCELRVILELFEQEVVTSPIVLLEVRFLVQVQGLVLALLMGGTHSRLHWVFHLISLFLFFVRKILLGGFEASEDMGTHSFIEVL